MLFAVRQGAKEARVLAQIGGWAVCNFEKGCSLAGVLREGYRARALEIKVFQSPLV